MMSEKRLTKEIAEQFLADNEPVDLSEFTELDDDAAESLSNYEGDLDLDGLTSVSDAAAESLSKYEGRLSLTRLTSLSEVTARHFVEGGKYRRHSVLVLGFQELPEPLLTALTPPPPPPPPDNPLDDIHDHFVWEDRVLCFPRVTNLTPDAAREFTRHDCGLHFHGLTSLSDELAEIFGQHGSGVSLDNVEELSDEAAETLRRLVGFVGYPLAQVYLDLDRLPESAVQILSDGHPG